MSNGTLSVITGPMFSGKSLEFVRRINRAKIANEAIFVFKPKIDNRFGDSYVVSRDNFKVEAVSVSDTEEIVSYLTNDANRSKFLFSRPLLIGIDEIQFIDSKIFEFIKECTKSGISFVVSGLDLDYREEPFETTTKLMALADEVVKLTAVCTSCFGNATRTHRIVDSEERVLVGNTEAYTALCTKCFTDRNVC
jgi:thymidine kinase